MKNRLLKLTTVSLLITIATIFISYFFLDRPLAFWVQDHQLSSHSIFKGLTYIASVIGAISFLCIPFFAALTLRRPLKGLEKIFFFTSLSVAIANFLKDSLKIIFGRYWIATWVDQNPSLLENNAYGFHFLHSGPSYGSFPSGHTVIICAAMTFLFLLLPKFRFWAICLVFLEILGLLAMNYHYLSDILGGAFIGIFSSLFFIEIANINRRLSKFF